MMFDRAPYKSGFHFCFVVCLLFSSCERTEDSSATKNAPNQATKQTPVKPVNFTAELTGKINSTIEGPGVITYIPASGERPGYYFIADDTGIRPCGLTITIPDQKGLGTFDLVSGSPVDAGKNFEIRVDQDMGTSVESWSKNTAGKIVLEAFPDSPTKLRGAEVTGSFEFTTQNTRGEEIEVTGKFSYQGK